MSQPPFIIIHFVNYFQYFFLNCFIHTAPQPPGVFQRTPLPKAHRPAPGYIPFPGTLSLGEKRSGTKLSRVLTDLLR